LFIFIPSRDLSWQSELGYRLCLLLNTIALLQFVPTSQIGVSSEGVTTLTSSSDGTTVTTVDLTAVTESTIGQEGHILLTGEDGQTYPVSVSGMITVPAMYQAVVANISQLQGQSDASVQVHPHA